MKIGIVTVAYITKDRHLELAKQTYESMKSNNELYKCCVITNVFSKEAIDYLDEVNDRVITSPQNCLAMAWNLGIQDCLDNCCNVVIVPNLDIIMQPTTIDRLAYFYDEKVLVWTANEYKGDDFSNLPVTGSSELQVGALFFCFACDERLFDKVGKFDERIIPAYWEDWDMDYRIRQNGFKSGHIDANVYHYGSQTIKNDLDAESFVNYNFQANRAYLASKHDINLQDNGTIAGENNQ